MGEMDWRNVIPVWQDEPWSMHFNSAYTKCAHFVLRILCSHRTFRVETCVSSPRDLGKDFQERLDNLSHEQDWIFIWGTFWDEIERDHDLERSIPTAGPPLLCGLFQSLGLRCWDEVPGWWVLRRSRLVGVGRSRKDVCFGFDSVHGAAPYPTYRDTMCQNVKYVCHCIRA